MNSKFITGVVGSGGNEIVKGEYSSTRLGVGRYKVTFDRASKTRPVVVASVGVPENNEWTAATTIHDARLGSFIVTTQDLGCRQVDIEFNFIAQVNV